jgi:hypothetical protein
MVRSTRERSHHGRRRTRERSPVASNETHGTRDCEAWLTVGRSRSVSSVSSSDLSIVSVESGESAGTWNRRKDVPLDDGRSRNGFESRERKRKQRSKKALRLKNSQWSDR